MTYEFDELPLRRDLRALRVERPASRDLWPAIEARLASAPGASRQRDRRGLRSLTGALAAALMLAVGIVLVARWEPPPGTARVDAAAVPPANASRMEDPAETVLAAYAEVLAAEQARGPEWVGLLDLPGGADRVAAARELDATLSQLAAALRVEPRSQLLRRLMHQTLQQRAALALDTLTA